MKITMLGTGCAVVTNCFNTCFVMEDGDEKLLVDGGGGITLLKQLKQAGISIHDIHEVFVTHRHLDHISGILWVLRVRMAHMHKHKDDHLTIYGHDEVIEIFSTMIRLILPERTDLLDKQVFLKEVTDGQQEKLMGRQTVFFDIRSVKAKQFGFCMMDGEHRITVCGDEPLKEHCRAYAQNAWLLMHEAFCTYADREIYKPYQKQHSTVKDACEAAESLHVSNLLLYHTEDHDMENRKEKYTAEGKQYYSGRLFVPDDLEVLEF